MSPSPSITRSGQGQPPAGGTQPRSGTRPPSTRSRDTAKAEWARGGRTGVPAPQRLEAGPRANIKGKMERENLFHGQLREEGLKEPGQQRSRAPSSPSCQPSPPTWAK